MPAQLLLFDPVTAREANRRGGAGLLADVPRARVTDPETSHRAAERIRETGQLRESQWLVLDAVTRWPGRTAVELGQLLAGVECRRRARPATWWRFECSRRLPELVPFRVRRGKPRVCSVNRNPQTTWYPVTEGAMAA